MRHPRKSEMASAVPQGKPAELDQDWVREGMREQRETSITRLAALKRKFIGQLLRQDNKFNLAKQFQLEYNQFVDANRDMMEE